MSETIFSKIIRKEIPAKVVYEDDVSLAFEDLHPQAPVHILVIPKKAIESLATAGEEDAPLLGHLQLVIQKLAKERGLDASGFRVVVNTGRDGGQTVPHLHYHLLGGRATKWPPG